MIDPEVAKVLQEIEEKAKSRARSVKMTIEQDPILRETLTQNLADLKDSLTTELRALQQSHKDAAKSIVTSQPQPIDVSPAIKELGSLIDKKINTLGTQIVALDRTTSQNKPLKQETISLAKVEKTLLDIAGSFDKIKTTWPSDPKNPIAVRLSDGKDFYNAIYQVFGSGGGGNVPKVTSTSNPQVQAVPVVNPDGSDISGGSGGSGVAAFSDSSNVDKKGLVDSDRHVQVDVLTMPGVTVDTTGLATDTNQTSELTKLDTIISDLEGTLTIGGSVTVSGTVTANAGTNLNTSALALESGGNLDTIAGKDFATQTTLALIKAKTDNIDVALSTRTKPADQQHVIIDSGSIGNTTFASTIADGANVTLGAKADAKSTATDTTAITIMQVLKEISYMEQNPASRAVTNAGTFATQSAITAASGSIASGAIASGAIASGAIASGAIASGAAVSGAFADGALVTLGSKADAKSTATDTTAITIMQVLKQISASVQAPPSQAVTNAGTFATQESGSLLTSAQLIDDIILANDAAAGSAKAALIGGQYNSSPAKVSASGDIVNLNLTQEGKILDVHSTVAADTTNVNNNYSSAQTNTSQQSAPGSNKRIVVVEIIYSKDTAGTMKLVEDPAGTPATKFGPHYFPANGGMVATKCYIPLTANKALGLTTTGGGNETFSCRTIIENV